MSSLALGFSETLPGSETLTIGSEALHVSRQSIKCDVGRIAGLSVLRLAGCRSASLLTVVGEPQVRLVEFEIRPTDAMISAGTRAELRDLYESVNGEETWYRLTTALPADFPLDRPHRVVLSQWHEHAPDGGDSLRPPLAHRLIDGTFVVSLWNQEIYDSGGTGDGRPIYEEPGFKAGVFHEFVYRIVWEPDSRGIVTGWRRERCLLAGDACRPSAWVRFVDYHGPIGYPHVLGYYFKFGVYTTHKFDTPLVAYHADFRRGASAMDVGATDPIFSPVLSASPAAATSP